MSCKQCKESWFWKKIGRCQRCMNQLTLLSIIGWTIWCIFFKSNPKNIESIALMMANFAFSGLLLLHLWVRYIVIPWRNR